jgi:lipoprotein-releasing system permease protein
MKAYQLYQIANRLTKSKDKLLGFANIVAMLSVVVGCLALILSLSILSGFNEKLQETAIKFTADICTQTINGTRIENADITAKQIANVSGVRKVVPVLQTEGIITSPSYTEGISLQSISFTNDAKQFRNNIVETTNPNIFSSDTANEIVISQTLARKLNVKLGDKLLVYALKNTDHISFSSATYAAFKVAAIYNTGMGQYDGSVVFFNYVALADFLEVPSSIATYYEVYADDLSDVSNVSRKIDEQLGYPFISFTYYEINRSIFAWIELQKEPIPIVLTIISIVAALNILTMLIITVVEKYHSIGILSAIGMTKRNIIQMFVMLAMRTAVIGAMFGAFISVGFILLQDKFHLITLDSEIYYVDFLPVSFDIWYVLGVILMTFIFAFFAALIPSIIAVRISPVKAIRFR